MTDLLPAVGRMSSPGGRRPSAAFLGLAGLVVVAGVAVRFALLGRQSYWGDELFSVNQSAGSFGRMLDVGSTEVHPPLWSALLWAWMKAGGTGETWTRLLSALLGVAAVVVTHRGTRGTGLGDHVRWALTAATAAGGTSLVYSLETRSYALLLLAATGLTLATLRASAATADGDRPGRRTPLPWTAWALLAATTHLFGAFLVLAAAGVLAVLGAVSPGGPGRSPGGLGRARRAAVPAALAAIACGPQVAWLLPGLGRPGFASGTRWIRAPDGHDLWTFLTTTFSAGTMTPLKDGFAWTSPLGVLAAALLCLAAAAAGIRTRRAAPAPPGPPPVRSARTAEARAAAVLLALAALVVVPSLAVSQRTHLWTLRNLVVVTPALVWGVICLAAAASGTAAGQRATSTAAVVLLGLSLVPTTAGLARPYKTDFRGTVEYLMAVRAEQPDATFVFFGDGSPSEWLAASGRPRDDPAWRTLQRRVARYPVGALDAVPRLAGTQVVVFHYGLADPRLDGAVAALIARLGPDGCHRVPRYGMGVVRCDPR